MTPKEREAAMERMADIVILSLETVVDNFAKIVAGEKRLGVAYREIKGHPVWELRMTTPPKVKVEEPDDGSWKLSEEELRNLK